MITAPAPIDFSKVFAGFKDMFSSGNVSVFFTIIGMFGLYIILGVYSRRMDKKEEAQVSRGALRCHDLFCFLIDVEALESRLARRSTFRVFFKMFLETEYMSVRDGFRSTVLQNL